MCIRDRKKGNAYKKSAWKAGSFAFGMNRNETYKNEYVYSGCLLYTSDAADERSSVDLGGRRIIKKKTKKK